MYWDEEVVNKTLSSSKKRRGSSVVPNEKSKKLRKNSDKKSTSSNSAKSSKISLSKSKTSSRSANSMTKKKLPSKLDPKRKVVKSVAKKTVTKIKGTRVAADAKRIIKASGKKLKDNIIGKGDIKEPDVKNENGKKKPRVTSKNSYNVDYIGELSKKNKLTNRIQFPNDDSDSDDTVAMNDDTMSVTSAVLDEDICYQCGLNTLDCLGNSNVILCDQCEGEYHLACVGLKIVPSASFICPKCVKERRYQSVLNFNNISALHNPDCPASDRKVVYSPSKPLDIAWDECQRKGLMIISELFSYDVMKQLTHGIIEKITTSGRVTETWHGATIEIQKRLGTANIINRDGRYDLPIPEYVVQHLQLNEILAPVLSKLRSIMGTPEPQLRTHNIVFVPVGSKEQQWHVDDAKRQKGKAYRYFTILIHLNSLDIGCGGTEIWINEDGKHQGDLIRGRPGDALIFSGSLLHRGQANIGKTHRYFYYASYSCVKDSNAKL